MLCAVQEAEKLFNRLYHQNMFFKKNKRNPPRISLGVNGSWRLICLRVITQTAKSWAKMCPQCWLVRACVRLITAQDEIVHQQKQKCPIFVCLLSERGGSQDFGQTANKTVFYASPNYARYSGTNTEFCVLDHRFQAAVMAKFWAFKAKSWPFPDHFLNFSRLLVVLPI